MEDAYAYSCASRGSVTYMQDALCCHRRGVVGFWWQFKRFSYSYTVIGPNGCLMMLALSLGTAIIMIKIALSEVLRKYCRTPMLLWEFVVAAGLGVQLVYSGMPLQWSWDGICFTHS